MKKTKPCQLSLTALSLLLSACGLKGGWLTTVGPNYHSPAPPTPSHWSIDNDSLIAHQGSVLILTKWWQGFNDPVLNRLLSAAQQENASISAAKVRIEQARSNLIGSTGSVLPNLDASMGSSRSSFSFGEAPFLRTQHQFQLQSNWEIDLFGGLARQQQADRSQLQSRHASWHDARVAVAVELANAYLLYRYCEIQVQLAQADSGSRQASAELLGLASNAGFKSPADIALANASTNEANTRVLQQKTQCERSIKGLVALTGLPENHVRGLLTDTAERTAKLPTPPLFQVNAVPATVIRQRPDIAAAERDMAEASAKIGVEQANRYPKLNLTGNITPLLQNINGSAFALANTWSIGPTLSLPLFDNGKRAANVHVAKAQYDATVAQYRAAVRTAVKEVEEAMLRLTSVEERLPLAHSASNDYQSHFSATEKLYQTGLGNLLDVENARRNLVNSESVTHALEYEKISAWIALYRAVGGSWQDQLSADKSQTNNTQKLSKQPSTLSRHHP
jgi:outer membrane protein, multidrug efflux system